MTEDARGSSARMDIVTAAVDPTAEARLLTQIRWVLGIALSGLVLWGSDTPPGHTEYLFVAIVLGSNAILWRHLPQNAQKRVAAIVAVDTLLVFFGFLFANAGTQDFVIAYFLCMLFAALGTAEDQVAGGAFLVTGFYALWVLRTESISNPFWVRLAFLFACSIFYGTVTLRLRAERHRAARIREQAVMIAELLDTIRSFSFSLIPERVTTMLTRAVREALRVSRCEVHLSCDEDAGSPCAEALRQRRPVLRTAGTGNVLAVPILHDAETLGILLVDSTTEGRPLQPDEIEFCRLVAGTAGAAIKNARQHQELCEMERTKTDFLSNLSHELRTPLNAIIGYASIALDPAGAADVAAYRGYVERISMAAERLREHVEDLLHFSNLTLGQERTAIERIDLGELLRSATEWARRLAGTKPIRIDYRIDFPARAVFADRNKIERILSSLLTNSIKFTKAGSVRVEIAPSSVLSDPFQDASTPSPRPWEQILYLRVSDTGVGIPEGLLSKIFDAFLQGDASTTRHYGGLGIGLTVCRRLSSVLGGTIRAQSRPGEGSIFEVVLPVQVEVAEVTRREEITQQVEDTSGYHQQVVTSS